MNPIHQALTALASANAFNGADSNFGTSLAQQVRDRGTLSEKQQTAGWRILQKYRAQLATMGINLPGICPSFRQGSAQQALRLGEKPATEFTGRVSRIFAIREDSGWAAFILTSERGEECMAAGVAPGIQEGVWLKVSGEWGEWNGRPQLNILAAQPVIRRTREGICEWLQLVKGIGERLSARIFDHFARECNGDGEKVWVILRDSPDRVLEVSGIRSTGLEIVERIRQHVQQGGLITWLMSVGLSMAYCGRILEEFGERALEVIEANPYELIRIRGIGFKKADQIAQNMGIAPDAPFRLQAGLVFLLVDEAAARGHCYLPLEKLFEAAQKLLGSPEAGVSDDKLDEALCALQERAEVVVEGEDVYPRSLHEAETDIARFVLMMTLQKDRAGVNSELLNQFQMATGITLHENQIDAVDVALRSPVSVITGLPGTGKSMVTKAIVALFEARKQTVALCAPTGRASKRLAQASGHDASTVHRLIGFRKSDDDSKQVEFLPYDVVIVDEASMLDCRLARALCRKINPKSQLILVGDVDQLPSVGPGVVLHDLIESGVVPVVRLTKIQRQAAGSQIITGAHQINAGSVPTMGGYSEIRDGAMVFVNHEDPLTMAEKIRSIMEDLKDRGFGLDDIALLAPQKTTQIGTHEMNVFFQATWNPDGKPITPKSWLRFGDKVMHIANNYQLGVFNGDIGWIVRPEDVPQEMRVIEDGADKTPPIVNYDGRLVAYLKEFLDELTLSYACSIHKAQGSEFPVVIVICHSSHYFMLARQLLYTGVTRGKKLVIIIGNRKGLWRAVNNAEPAKRYTGLMDRLITGAF